MTSKKQPSETSSEPDLGKADYETLAAFRYVLRHFLRASEDRAYAVGLTNQQYLALLAIKGFPGRDSLTVGELAERLQIRHHSAVGLVDRLEALDLVSRQAATLDRRQVYVALTDAGTATLRKLAGANRAQLRHLSPELVDLMNMLTDE